MWARVQLDIQGFRVVVNEAFQALHNCTFGILLGPVSNPIWSPAFNLFKRTPNNLRALRQARSAKGREDHRRAYHHDGQKSGPGQAMRKGLGFRVEGQAMRS